MIKGILFDFGQTLVNSADGFKQAEREAKEWICHDLFPDADEKGRQVFLESYRRIRKSFHERSVFSRPAIWDAVYHHFGCIPDPIRLETEETRYWETVKRFTQPFPEAVEVLTKLAGQYLTALITNTQGQRSAGSHRISLFPELEHFFKAIIVAGESGMPAKPDPAPFKNCLDDLGIEPAEAVYVGDDWRIDIKGAQNAGLHAVWLKHHSVKRNWPDVATTVPVITCLDQLPEAVATLLT